MTDTSKSNPDSAPALVGQPLVSLSGLGEAITAGMQLAGIGPRLAFLEDPDREGQPGAKVPIALIDAEGKNAKVVVLDDVAAAFAEQAPGPRRREGTVALTDEDSFIAFINRWGNDDTVIYANTDALAFVAVMDDHPQSFSVEATRWREHRATYACPRDPAWKAWIANDGVGMAQVAFADFIESRLEDLVRTDGCAAPLDVLQMARQLTIRTKGTYQRDLNPTTGDSILINKTETDTGSTVIPRAFALAIPVFEGGERYQIEARVRFGFVDGAPRFSYTLHRRKEIERDAFNAVRRKIDGATGRLVLAGTP